MNTIHTNNYFIILSFNVINTLIFNFYNYLIFIIKNNILLINDYIKLIY